MTRSNSHFVKDILKEIAHIQKSIENVAFEQFEEDYEKHYAVVRALEIIGEAANKLGSELQENNPQIEWAKIIGLRNVIVHDYFELDLRIIWEVVHKDIPVLKSQIVELLKTI